MSYCNRLDHKLAGDLCYCGLQNAQATGQNQALYSDMYGQQAAAMSALAMQQAMANSNAPQKRPCEVCGADAYGAAEVKAADGSVQRVSMCGDCARAITPT